MTEQTQPSQTPDVANPKQEAQNEAIHLDSTAEPSQTQGPKSAQQSSESPPALVDLSLRIEAALISTDRAINASKLSDLFEGVPTRDISNAIDQLNKIYTSTNRSFRIEKLAGGWQIVTLPQYAQVLANLHKTRASNKLTTAALETLAIIAYKQPVLRAEIEAIRGVSTGETVRSLMQRHLVKIVGRAEEIGRPMLYGTTKAFLEVFGLASLKDLPNAAELRPPKPRMLIQPKDELDDNQQAVSPNPSQMSKTSESNQDPQPQEKHTPPETSTSPV